MRLLLSALPHQLRSGTISVVVPTLNEAGAIPRLAALRASEVELIISDGGSVDQTVPLALAHDLRVVEGARGRGAQMNRGAAEASGNILLFLHADTRLPDGWADAVRDTLARPGVVAGAFGFRTDAPGGRFRLLEWLVRLRPTPYGDQAIFLLRDVFEAVGGFPEWPIMEDPELVRRLRRRGRVEIAPLDSVVSARRYEQYGLLRTTWLNQKCLWAWRMGVAPGRIAKWRSNQEPRPADGRSRASSRPASKATVAT